MRKLGFFFSQKWGWGNKIITQLDNLLPKKQQLTQMSQHVFMFTTI